MSAPTPQQIVDEIERLGGSIRAGCDELLVELPVAVRNTSWVALLRREKGALLRHLTIPRVDRADYLAHVAHFQRKSESPQL
jgi:hypothetical protein